MQLDSYRSERVIRFSFLQGGTSLIGGVKSSSFGAHSRAARGNAVAHSKPGASGMLRGSMAVVTFIFEKWGAIIKQAPHGGACRS
ncbi:hypothetical protein D3C72_2129530 [compost metagenome]